MTNTRWLTRTAAGFCICGIVAAAVAQSPPSGKTLAASAGVLAYPAKGQGAEQQTRDEAECYNWAKTQSGYDPMSPPPAQTPPPQSQSQSQSQSAPTGARARGMLKGAVAGAVIGEAANNDAGDGAAIGATAGLLAAGRQSRMAQARQQQQAQAQQQASAEQAKATQQQLAASFRSGLSLCLEARGYAVK